MSCYVTVITNLQHFRFALKVEDRYHPHLTPASRAITAMFPGEKISHRAPVPTQFLAKMKHVFTLLNNSCCANAFCRTDGSCASCNMGAQRVFEAVDDMVEAPPRPLLNAIQSVPLTFDGGHPYSDKGYERYQRPDSPRPAAFYGQSDIMFLDGKNTRLKEREFAELITRGVVVRHKTDAHARNYGSAVAHVGVPDFISEADMPQCVRVTEGPPRLAVLKEPWEILPTETRAKFPIMRTTPAREPATKVMAHNPVSPNVGVPPPDPLLVIDKLNVQRNQSRTVWIGTDQVEVPFTPINLSKPPPPLQAQPPPRSASPDTTSKRKAPPKPRRSRLFSPPPATTTNLWERL